MTANRRSEILALGPANRLKISKIIIKVTGFFGNGFCKLSLCSFEYALYQFRITKAVKAMYTNNVPIVCHNKQTQLQNTGNYAIAKTLNKGKLTVHRTENKRPHQNMRTIL